MFGWVRTRGRVAGVCVVAAMAVTGCGTATKGGSSGVTVTGHTLSVYASQPPGPPTPAETDLLDAERLALQQAQGKAGSFTVRLVAVHEHELSANARTAIENSNTIAYIGELVPGTSQISVEITPRPTSRSRSPASRPRPTPFSPGTRPTSRPSPEWCPAPARRPRRWCGRCRPRTPRPWP
jgi:hypothetical protein